MPEGLDTLAKGIGKAIETVPELYQDAFQPSVQETGKLIARIPHAINAAFSGLDKWILNKEYSVEETKKLLAQKLENVEPEKIVEPEPYVAIPALQAISYSMNSDELRNLYANLLAKSMNSDTKDMVHPSFVEIIKQMSPNDALVFNEIASCTPFYLISLAAEEYPPNTITVNELNKLKITPIKKYSYKNITSIQFIDYNSVLISLDNLMRLRLIEEKVTLHEKFPQNIKITPQYLNFQSELQTFITTPNWNYSETKKIAFLTDLGKHFYNICVCH